MSQFLDPIYTLKKGLYDIPYSIQKVRKLPLVHIYVKYFNLWAELFEKKIFFGVVKKIIFLKFFCDVI